MFEEYCETAKRGTWRKIGGVLRNLASFTAHGITLGGEYACDFHSLTAGGFFVRLESPNSTHYHLILVAPDNSLNWASISSMTVQGAIEYLRDYTAQYNIPYWRRFVEWFDGVYARYGGVIVRAFVCNHEPSYIPSYSNPNHEVSVWFAWLAQIGQLAGLSSERAADYKVSDYQYNIPLLFYTNRGTFSFGLRIAI